MKICGTCNIEKEDGDFHKRKASKDGLAARCKECQRQYDKARANDPERVKAREEYQKTPQGQAAVRRAKERWALKNKGKVAESTKRYREKNPNKYRAHGIVAYAIKQGNLYPEPCEICGKKKTEAHHDDYSKPLNVRWLCSKHHKQWHTDNGEGANP